MTVFFNCAFQPVRFTYQALFLSLAKVLFRPTTVLIIAVLSFIVFDLDFEVVWEEGDEDDEDDEDDDQLWEDPADFDRLGT
ncbi:hypothetical protein BGZ54_003466 [Gamsiella multidivaricata]|nr:hypothetical protein BGZ54_003466 [Gamsiella multidivaricata]